MIALIEPMNAESMRAKSISPQVATAARVKRSIDSGSRGIASPPAIARKIGS